MFQVQSPVILAGSSKQTLTLSSLPNFTGALEAGVYGVWSTADLAIGVFNPPSTGFTNANGYLVKASLSPVPVYVPTNFSLGAATLSSAAGACYYQKIS